MAYTHDEIAQLLLEQVREFLIEMESLRALDNLSLDSVLERDLGIGSLERAELLQRTEKTFKIQLSAEAMQKVQSLQDLVILIARAEPTIPKLTKKFVSELAAVNVDPSQTQTLLEVIRLYGEQRPKRPHVYVQDEFGNEKTLSYGALYHEAQCVAQGMLAHGLKQGETIAIMLPSSQEFFFAFVGALLAGCIPVPIYPPMQLNKIEEYTKREALLLRNAGVRMLVTFAKAERLCKLLQTFVPSLLAITTVDALKQDVTNLPEISVGSDDIAMLQYTSGSTGNPKGVVLTHANLLANMRAFGEAVQLKPTDKIVSWLPLYHDMGLIGAWLGSLYHGIPLTLLSPLTFLTRPERWLWAIHYHRATISGGPNFAYELCLKKIDPAKIEGLDLSSWRLAFNGAEAIHASTIRRFSAKFAAYGFRKSAMYPVYGLAECAVALCFPAIGSEPCIDRVQREAFEHDQRALPAAPHEKRQEFVACGTPLPGHAVRIVDNYDQLLPERMVGHVQFTGPSSMQGYYRNPAETAAVFHDGWWGTGDLGYIADDQLYITGRKKDLIIKAGRNYYPDEFEELASYAEGVRKGSVIAFGTTDARTGTEKIILIAEKQAKSILADKAIFAEITQLCATHLGVVPDQITLVPAKSIPKTSSGKLQRSALKEDYISGKVGKAKIPAWAQMAKLYLASIIRRCINGIKMCAKAIYTVYAVAIWLITLLPVWGAIHFLPKQVAAQLTKLWSRVFLILIACPLKINGKANLQAEGSVIYIANHASYLDAVVLVAILPAGSLLVGKQELRRAPLLGAFIKHLGYPTVDRIDFSKNMAATEQLATLLQAGESLIIFPEGTFTFAEGIRPFKLGAFSLAAKTITPLCPIALKGTRGIMRDGTRLLRPGCIGVTINPVLVPESQAWDEVVRLRNRARIMIAKDSGEDTLDLVDVRIPA